MLSWQETLISPKDMCSATGVMYRKKKKKKNLSFCCILLLPDLYRTAEGVTVLRSNWLWNENWFNFPVPGFEPPYIMCCYLWFNISSCKHSSVWAARGKDQVSQYVTIEGVLCPKRTDFNKNGKLGKIMFSRWKGFFKREISLVPCTLIFNFCHLCMKNSMNFVASHLK